jgi:hypothetical protein
MASAHKWFAYFGFARFRTARRKPALQELTQNGDADGQIHCAYDRAHREAAGTGCASSPIRGNRTGRYTSELANLEAVEGRA